MNPHDMSSLSWHGRIANPEDVCEHARVRVDNEPQELDVTMPAGVDTGMQLRLVGKGEVGDLVHLLAICL